MDLFWIFHISGIIQSVTICVWLLSLSILLRFIQVIAYIGVTVDGRFGEKTVTEDVKCDSGLEGRVGLW